ncbi:MAG TPA: ATP-NAD kinase [Thermoplasmatales archaeon]|nr:ATP-NAD kinase [Thermoplasmatales archaeon]
MMKVGFIVNPIAGMGGRVGLKGTDGVLGEALRRGASSVAPEKAEIFLRALKKEFEFYTCSSPMGENIFKKLKKNAKVVYHPSKVTTAEDTKKASEKLAEIVDLIIFVGGDGTACDIFDAIDAKVPIIGIPAGVKMYSAVFAFTPLDAVEIVEEFEKGKVEEREVMDIDEEAFRRGEFRIKLKGYVLTPVHEKIQTGKEILQENGKEEIASWMVENMDQNTVYIIGGGSTTFEIKKAIGIDGSFLGIDVVKENKLVCKDAGEREIKNSLDKKNKIIVTPLGGHGFIFGRGNQPISPEIIKMVGRENIIIVSTKSKLNKLKNLKVDTGDKKVDEMLRGYVEVITGYREKRIMKVE